MPCWRRGPGNATQSISIRVSPHTGVTPVVLRLPLDLPTCLALPTCVCVYVATFVCVLFRVPCLLTVVVYCECVHTGKYVHCQSLVPTITCTRYNDNIILCRILSHILVCTMESHTIKGAQFETNLQPSYIFVQLRVVIFIEFCS